MINVNSSGSFKKTIEALERSLNGDIYDQLDQYGRMGVDALASATPTESGLTAASWRYEISRAKNGVAIWWINTNVNDGVNVAILIQYGHGTGTGGYVAGRDYINPAIQHVFDRIVTDIGKKVSGV